LHSGAPYATIRPFQSRDLEPSSSGKPQFNGLSYTSDPVVARVRPKGGQTVLSQYAFIGIFAIIAFALPIIGLAMSWLIRPKKPNRAKNATYECGMETIGDTWVQFKAQYYLYALIFVVFDVEAIFIFPWAIAYNKLGLYALVEMVLFVLILLGGLLYAWRKRALEWH
jgi:NADH:ubiquinone oxidoreductase subunit 3 (subunit A)